jgi:hypothetical protein
VASVTVVAALDAPRSSMAATPSGLAQAVLCLACCQAEPNAYAASSAAG